MKQAKQDLVRSIQTTHRLVKPDILHERPPVRRDSYDFEESHLAGGLFFVSTSKAFETTKNIEGLICIRAEDTNIARFLIFRKAVSVPFL